MKKQELTERSIHIISQYYQGSLESYFDAIAEHVLWVGPRGGQILQGKDVILETWNAAEHNLRFTMGNIEAKSVSAGAGNLEVLLEYFVYTHFPGGHVDRHHQRLHLSWGYERQKETGERLPKIFMIHISNIPEEPEQNSGNQMKVYAEDFAESNLDAIRVPDFSRIHFRNIASKGANEVTYYFNSSTIIWIGSTDRSTHSVLHTLEGPFASIEKLRWFETEFPDVFLRAHASFLINPLYVRSVKRFEVTMTDGTVIPVPQKKYTAFRERLNDWDWNRKP